MSDATLPNPPHPPRWSKTAAIVVLLVFSLVVVVALFGLWAFSKHRDADNERRHTHEMDLAAHMLDDVHGAVRETLSAAMAEAAHVEDAPSLWRVLRGDGAPVRRMCRYAGAEVFWIDNEFLLRLPEKALADWADTQQQVVDGAVAEVKRLESLQDDPVTRLRAWTEHVRDYLVVARSNKGEALLYPTALDHVTAMLDVAHKVPVAEGLPEIRNAMLAALTAEGLNRSRADLDPADRDKLLARIRASLDVLHAKLPEDEPPYVRWEVEQFERLRDVLADAKLGSPIDAAIRAARLEGARPKPGQVHLYYAGHEEVVAVVAHERLKMLTALQLDWNALRRFVVAEINNPRWATPGFELKLKTDDMAPSSLPEKQLSDLQSHWNLPLRVIVEEEHGAAFGSASDWFYWGIIALACVGIAIGGWVLVRLLTRQVRLAELKADFVSNLSHELKTPITSIGLFAEMLQDGKLDSDAGRAEAYGVIAQETDRLKHTVARMLGVAHRAASRSPYRMQPGDLNTPVRDAVERFRRLVSHEGLKLEVMLSSAPLPMTLDEDALGDVATNLLTNAWKYRRGEAAHVRVRTLRRRGKAVLEVSDDGIGVPRAERRRIFQMFYRSEQYLSQRVSGTGLGLALVRTVVRGHHGRIRILDGLRGKGSTFEATFPLARDQEVTQDQGTPRSGGHTGVTQESAGRRSKQPSEHRRSSGPAAEHS